ncbi:MAG: hypothetical protein GTN78_05415 [Gemmatimonadales bacterium]|nr:hypothetical protein [Gemmatimonadales bacterium]NIN12734.1 hypothetical protein [Gemmatimonadales bacterium]NIQ99625.1 hypothetical protein [Gemmatimonadales bacterium]NIS64182.1 hypothetical protein [Gemmatimonadales bacterium]
MLDAGLGQADTLLLTTAAPLEQPVTHVQFAHGGTSLYAALGPTPPGVLLRVRRIDGTVLEQAVFPTSIVTALALSPDARSLVAAVVGDQGTTQRTGALYFISSDGFRQEAHVAVCHGPVRGLSGFFAREKLYVACEDDTVAEVDAKLRLLVRAAALAPEPTAPASDPCLPSDIALSRNGTIVFVLCGASGRILYVDRVVLQPFDSVDVGAGASQLALSPNGRWAVVTHTGRDEVLVVDLRRRLVTAQVPTPGRPYAVAVGSDGRWAYVAAEGADSEPGVLLQIDLQGRRSTAQIAMPYRVTGVSVWPGSKSPVMRWSTR